MHSTPTISDELISSFIQEAKIKKALKSLKWHCIHGAYYKDNETLKLREIDVLAKKHWKCTNDRQELKLSVSIHAECKTIKDYAIVFNEISNDEPNYSISHHHWFGYEEVDEKLHDLFKKFEIPKRQSTALLNYHQSCAYPDTFMCTSEIRIEPPAASHRATAFKEIYIGQHKEKEKAKDLDNSVIWKGGQSLRSSVTSSITASMDFDLSEIECGIRCHKATNGMYDSIRSEIHSATARHRIFHPVLIVNSPLFVIKRKSLSEIDWCRVELHGEYGLSSWWFDVVNIKNISAYFKKITSHYRPPESLTPEQIG